MPTNQDGPLVRQGGLVAIAYLKANLDGRNDHLGIFMPLVLDVLSRSSNDIVLPTDVQARVASDFGLAMPLPVITALLRRAAKNGYLLPDAGVFRRNVQRRIAGLNVTAQQTSIKESQSRLGDALMAHAVARGLPVGSSDEALGLLFAFLEEEQVGLLLSKGSQLPTKSPRKERVVVAEFVQDVVMRDQSMHATLKSILEGLVLYNAAFLPDISLASRRLNSLSVLVDSVLVRQALGYEGTAPRVLVSEIIDVLKANGVRLLVLDKSIEEIKRILAMYEQKIGTLSGRSTLIQYAMARHLLVTKCGPGEIRQMSALLPTEVLRLGFQIAESPQRTKEHTLSEQRLAERLAAKDTADVNEPRVQHDVDCIAAVLTLRSGKRSKSIEGSGYVFATSATLLIRNTLRWWEEDEGESSFPPIVGIKGLANLAWLRKPALCADFKINELVALCGAALRPQPKTWDRFLRHLGALVDSRQITSDEMTAVVVSELSDRLLAEAEFSENGDGGLEATSLDDIVERVKLSYIEEHARKVAELEAQHTAKLSSAEATALRAQSSAEEAVRRAEDVERAAVERAKRREAQLQSVARAIAAPVAWVMWGVLSLAVVAGGVALIVGHPLHGGLVGMIVGSAIVIFVLLEALGILGHLREWRTGVASRIEAWCVERLATWFAA